MVIIIDDTFIGCKTCYSKYNSQALAYQEMVYCTDLNLPILLFEVTPSQIDPKLV